MIDRGRNVLAPALRFDNSNAGQSNEERIVSGTAFSRPLRNGHGAAFGGSSACGKSDCLRLRFPPATAQLLIDDLPRCAFVQLDRLRSLLAFRDESKEVDRLRLGTLLQGFKPRTKVLLFQFDFLRKLFPGCPVLCFVARALLGGLPRVGGFLGSQPCLLGGGLRRQQFGSQALQFDANRSRCILRRGGRLERSGSEFAVVPESAMKPNCGLPSVLERIQCLGERAACSVRGGVSKYAEIVKEVGNFGGKNAFEP